MTRTSWTLGAAVLLLAAAGSVRAEPGPPPGGAALLLSIGRTPGVEHREAAYDEALREAGPPVREPAGVVQPDGSVRYGRLTVTVKEYCPPLHDEPPPLPGRRLRK
jgi:hypothetical protein